MARDYWQTYRPAVKIGKTNKTITIPSFSVPCGKPKGCLEFKTKSSYHFFSVTSDPTERIKLKDKFFVEAWIKPKTLLLDRDRIILAFYNADYTTPAIKLFLRGSIVSGVVYKGLDSFTISSDVSIDADSWSHIGFKFDGANISLYVNGELASGNLAVTPQLNYAKTLAIGAIKNDDLEHFIGLIGDIRVWSIPPSDEEILFMFDKHRNPNPNLALDETLTIYFDFRFLDTSYSNLTFWNQRSRLDLGAGITGEILQKAGIDNSSVFVDDESAPIGLGGSFIVAEFPCTLTQNIALKYPIKPPGGSKNCNFLLAVRWTDEDGVLQRRKLWDLLDDDIAPDYALYQGETIGNEFTFEIWNIDGESTVDLESDLVLITSLLHNIEYSKDTTIVSLGTLIEDSSIYAAFPWDFEQTFDESYDYGEQSWTELNPFLLAEDGHAILTETGEVILL